MKTYFDRNLIFEAHQHAKAVYPEEACGFLLKDRYMRMDNFAKDRTNTFKINHKEFLTHQEGLLAIMHSHGDYPHLSAADMEQQIETGVPWGITFVDKGFVTGTYFWGDDLEPQDLIGRQFIHGLYDCYATVRDYWRLKGFDIPDFPRDNLWWEKNPSMLEELYKEAGFDYIDESELKEGDSVVMKVLSNVTNHSAIVLNDGLILHHLYGRYSRREPLNRWKKFVTGYLRYKHA